MPIPMQMPMPMAPADAKAKVAADANAKGLRESVRILFQIIILFHENHLKSNSN